MSSIVAKFVELNDRNYKKIYKDRVKKQKLENEKKKNFLI